MSADLRLDPVCPSARMTGSWVRQVRTQRECTGDRPGGSRRQKK